MNNFTKSPAAFSPTGSAQPRNLSEQEGLVTSPSLSPLYNDSLPPTAYAQVGNNGRISAAHPNGADPVVGGARPKAPDEPDIQSVGPERTGSTAKPTPLSRMLDLIRAKGREPITSISDDDLQGAILGVLAHPNVSRTNSWCHLDRLLLGLAHAYRICVDPRIVRDAIAASSDVMSTQKGYKLVSKATENEIKEFDRDNLSRQKQLELRRSRVMNRWHALQHPSLPVDRRSLAAGKEQDLMS